MGEKPKSLAIFKDGHEEEILYMREFSSYVEFSTKSGFYVYKNELNEYGICGFCFYKLKFELVHRSYSTTIEPKLELATDIKEIQIDERISIKYKARVGPLCRENEILVPRTFSDLQIKNEILKNSEIDIQYEKCEEHDIHGETQ